VIDGLKACSTPMAFTVIDVNYFRGATTTISAGRDRVVPGPI
jgi:hypothetical protein